MASTRPTAQEALTRTRMNADQALAATKAAEVKKNIADNIVAESFIDDIYALIDNAIDQRAYQVKIDCSNHNYEIQEKVKKYFMDQEFAVNPYRICIDDCRDSCTCSYNGLTIGWLQPVSMFQRCAIGRS